MDLVVFGIIMVILAASFGVPFLRYKERRLGDADAVVLSAAILSIGLGAVNYVFLMAYMITEEFVVLGLPIGLAPIAAGLLGAYVIRTGSRDTQRLLLLAGASLLVLAGIPAYLAFTFAVFVTAVTGILYLMGIFSPLRLFKALDPRN